MRRGSVFLLLVSFGCGGGSPRIDPPTGGSPSTLVPLGDGGLAVFPDYDGGSLSSGGPLTVSLPSLEGWEFYGPQQGGPSHILGITADQGGNVWVAGGEDGLFLLRPGHASFQTFTLQDGLHPYGYMPDGSDAPGPHYLNVVSVSGGGSGTVFVGYRGRTTNGDVGQCESNWDDPGARDPSVYKSGDADRVTLVGNGLSVVHYDIFSGPGMVAAEPAGREKLCNIWRVQYVPETHSVWFGGNHGFAWGDPDFPGIQATGCTEVKYGNYGCSGLLEHAHPMVNAYSCNAPAQCPTMILLTDAYWGIASDGDGGMWIGGANRSLHYDFGPQGKTNFWTYEANQGTGAFPYQMDIWPDAASTSPTPDQRKDDVISSIAVTGDGTAWLASFAWGVAHVSAQGQVLAYFSSSNGLIATQTSAIAADPVDRSIWVGGGWGGITRIQGGRAIQYSDPVFGQQLTSGPVADIQMSMQGGARKVLVGFGGSASFAGGVGIYSGN